VSALAFVYSSESSARADWFVSLLLALPPTMLMGMGYPVGLRVWATSVEARGHLDGSRVGDLNAANLAGGIAGAVLGGFVALPWLGTRLALGALASAYVLAFLLVLGLLRVRPLARLAMGAAAVAVFAITAQSAPDVIALVSARRYPPGERLMWREEGLQTTAAVHVRPVSNRILYLDGLHQASDLPEMVRLHRLIGHLPIVLHSAPRRALVVGMGGGVTPGAVSQHGAQVDLVELSRAVVNAAPWFRHVSYDVLRQPNVRLHVDDGRNFLLMADERYDVVTADLIQPEHAGAGNLYSHEYFSLVRRAIQNDGLVLQWLGHRREADYKLILRTFLDVFPYTTLWAEGQLMLGAVRPLRIDAAAFDAKLARPETRAALEEIGLDRFEQLTALYTAGPDEIRAFVGDGPILQDDRPRVEYFRSLAGTGTALVDLSALRGDVTRLIGR
jgi:spermidine synthase